MALERTPLDHQAGRHGAQSDRRHRGQARGSRAARGRTKARSPHQTCAEGFYAEHKARPFFAGSSKPDFSPVVVQVLEGENAIARNREVMARQIRKRRRRERCASFSPWTSSAIRFMARILRTARGVKSGIFADTEIAG